MIRWLEETDRALFLTLNGSDSAWMDTVFSLASQRYVWIPFYFLLLLLVLRHFRKRTWIILVSVGLLITASDQISVLVKNKMVRRYRPCHNLELQPHVKLNGSCGGQYGFVSSHAANAFALAAFFFLLFRRRKRWPGILMVVWAGFVAYSRVYNGVHYPLDLAAGAMVGIALAILIYFLYRQADLKIYGSA